MGWRWVCAVYLLITACGSLCCCSVAALCTAAHICCSSADQAFCSALLAAISLAWQLGFMLMLLHSSRRWGECGIMLFIHRRGLTTVQRKGSSYRGPGHDLMLSTPLQNMYDLVLPWPVCTYCPVGWKLGKANRLLWAILKGSHVSVAVIISANVKQ